VDNHDSFDVLKPLSVTLPVAARFTDGEDSEPRSKAHSTVSES
jgi:hypothetical protein